MPSPAQYYPSLSTLVDFSALGSDLQFIETMLTTVLDKIFCYDVQINKLGEGDSEYYRMTLVTSEVVGIENLFGVNGLDFVFLPNDVTNPLGTFSEVDIEIFWKWIIVKYIKRFKDIDKSDIHKAVFEILLDIIGLTKEEFMEAIMEAFLLDPAIPSTDPAFAIEDLTGGGSGGSTKELTNLITTINGNSAPGVANIPTTFTAISDVIAFIEDGTSGLGEELFSFIYSTLINTQDVVKNLEALFKKWLGQFNIDNILQLIKPTFKFTAKDLRVGLAFPQTWLQPIDANLKPTTGRSQVTYTAGTFSFSSETGIDFDTDMTAELNRSMIANSGFWIEFSGATIDLSRKRAQPTAADYGIESMGFHVQTLNLGLPKFFDEDTTQKASNALIQGTNIYAGTLGFEGDFALVPLPGSPRTTVECNVFNLFIIEFSKAELSFKSSDLDSVDFEGHILVGGKVSSADGSPKVGFALTYDKPTKEFTFASNQWGNAQHLGIRIGEFALGVTNFSLTLIDGDVTTATVGSFLQIPGFVNRTSNLPIQILTSYTFARLASGEDQHLFELQTTTGTGTGGAAPTTTSSGAIGPLDLEISTLSVEMWGLNREMTVQNAALSCLLSFPDIKDASGQIAKISIDYSYLANITPGGPTATPAHDFSLSAVATGLHFKDFSIELSSFAFRLVGGELTNLSGGLKISHNTFKDYNNPANPAVIDLNYSLVNDPILGQQHKVAMSNSGFPIKIGGAELIFTELGFEFTPTKLDQFNIAGVLILPGLEEDSSNTATAPNNADLGLAPSNNDLKIVFSYEYESANDFHQFKAGGPAGSGAVAFVGKIGANLLTIEEVVIGFDEINGLRDDSLIRGKLKMPAFDKTIGISIKILEDGFEVIVDADPAINVLDIEVLKIGLSKLRLGKKGANWSFGIGASFETKIDLPIVGDIIPKKIDIKEFTFDYNADIIYDIDFVWSTFSFSASSADGLEATIPIKAAIGKMLYLHGLQISGKEITNGFELDLALTGVSLKIGPVDGFVEGMGLRTNIVKQVGGNLGNHDMQMEFLPPKGIGASVDTTAFKGGGYLYLDHENKRYAGALELTIVDVISVTAVGLLTTRMPDGSEGVSFLIIISVIFPVPIPLPFNLYIAGVGGILGIHRTINTDALIQGVQSNAIDNILFPEDVVENIHQIVTDLRTIFPPAKDQFVIGVMARLTWFNPALVSLDIGLIIEFSNPVRIAILGVLKAILPTKEAAIVTIQVNFAGIIDFERKMLSFDASLVNSNILGLIDLFGDLALRVGWGDNPDFLLSAGGFHPSFTPPTHLSLPATIRRMGLSMFGGVLSLETYFAITSNTVQLGAAVIIKADVKIASIEGRFGFDLLFQFNPFYFIASVYASLTVKIIGIELMGIKLRGDLEGPTPFIFSGRAEFKLLFAKKSFKVRKVFGDERKDILPSIDILPLVLEDLQKDDNWRIEFDENRYDLVAIRENYEENVSILPSFGNIVVKQEIVPLGVEISKFGNYTPLNETHFDISSATLGGGPAGTEHIKSFFAPDSYKEMSDDSKLRAPSYESLKSGVKIKSTRPTDIDVSYFNNRQVEYEVITSDIEIVNTGTTMNLTQVSENHGLQAQPRELFVPFVAGGAIADSSLAQKNRQRKMADKSISLKEETYAIVNTDNLQAMDPNTYTQAEAEEKLQQMISGNTLLKDQLQVIPTYLVN